MRYFLFVLIFLATPAYASECSQYLGQTIQLTEIETALKAFSKITPKGEFETTAQHEERTKTELESITKTFTIPIHLGKIYRNSHYKYNADSDTYTITQYNVDSISGWKDFKPGSSYKYYHIMVANKKTTFFHPYGEYSSVYEATTIAYGIGYQIGKSYSKNKLNNIIGKIKVKPSLAQQLKESLHVAVLATAKPPYIESISSHHTSGLNKSTTNYEMLIADIKCRFVLDGENNVLGAFPTQ
ncbi:MAG: hypothetical protein COA47_07325 [Robiginitomaculum sp.]|nr:MAG: hypothetical protein COA47_07325 [Robiginitomaculum sp.]